jgi:two-component system LytT family response regulator
MVTRTLKEYDQLLGDSGFFRVHQSHLVNKKHITAYVKTEGGYLLMSNNQHVAVSLRKKASVMEMLDNL